MLYIYEGVNGVGKTYHINKLKSRLQSNNKKFKIFQTTKEFATLTSLVLTKPDISEFEKATMFSIAQFNMLYNMIIPALNDNYTVICDRLWLTTLVYQSNVLKTNTHLKSYIYNQLTNSGVTYKYKLLIDNPVNILTRIKNRNNIDSSNNLQYVEYKNNLDKSITLSYLKTLQDKFIKVAQDLKDLPNVNVTIKNLSYGTQNER